MEMRDLFIVSDGIKYIRVLSKDNSFEESCERCSILMESPLCRSLSCSYYANDIAGEKTWWHWGKWGG